MAGALGTLQLASQVSNAQNTLSQAIANPAGILDSCKDPGRPEELEAKEEEEEEYVAPPAEQTKTFTLRMCVHSGENLPREKTYVVVVIGEGESANVKQSEVAPESEHPVWEFCFDEEIVVSGRGAPKLEIKVFSKRLVGDSQLGATGIRLPSAPTEGPKRQVLKLGSNQPGIFGGCKPPKMPKMDVVWQVCESTDFAPDLNRVAEMDFASMEKNTYTVAATVYSLELKRPTLGQQKVGISLKVKRPDGDITKTLPTRNSPQTLTYPNMSLAKEGLVGSKETKLIPNAGWRERDCKAAIWADFVEDEQAHSGWSMDPWTLRDSQVSLLSSLLEVQLFLYNKIPADRFGRRHHDHDVPTKLGSWREPLVDLMDTISQSDQQLRFDAAIESNDGQVVGSLRMMLDVFTEQRHKEPPNIAKILDGAVLTRKGMPLENLWQQKITYHCTVFVDGLQVADNCHPYVKITMGSSSSCTEVKASHEVNDVRWPRSVMIQTKVATRKAKIEVYNSTQQSGFGGGLTSGADHLLCEHTIYDVAPEKEYWMHCFGGAIGAPRGDMAMQMVKGTNRPPSTYTGTVVVQFGTKRQSQNYFSQLVNKRAPRRLAVRLYSGANLEQFAGRKVKILVQVAGCRLPDMREVQRLERVALAKKKAEETGKKADAEAARALESAAPDPRTFNRNLLSFGGEVDSKGVLRFYDDNNTLCSWVERRTPRAFPLKAPPSVTHAYIYIVPQGEEAMPPRVFGRLRLNDNEPEDNAPRWKRMRFDTSVVQLPEAHFPSSFAGFILGSASLLNPNAAADDGSNTPNASPKSVPKTEIMKATDARSLLPKGSKAPWCPACAGDQILGVGSPGEPDEVRSRPLKASQTVYCHVDILAARDLPAMDDDGLMDPCYIIRIWDQELRLAQSTEKSLSPSFMHRAVIPFQIEVPTGPGQSSVLARTSVPLPPLILKMQDYDERHVMGLSARAEHQDIGTIVVKHDAQVNENDEQVFQLLDYNKSKVVSVIKGDEFVENPAPLDLNCIHEAIWHALDKPARTPFDCAAGGVDPSWNRRPRVLMAVGYSMQQEMTPYSVKLPPIETQLAAKAASNAPQPQLWKMDTPDMACFEIDINLLGLRNMHDSLTQDAKLYISAAWEGPSVEFDVGGGGFGLLHDNTNLISDGSTQDVYCQEHIKKMRPVLRLMEKDSPEEEEYGTPCILLEDLVGVKVRAPVYRVPVIDYLQEELLHPGNWTMKKAVDADQDADVETIRFKIQYVSGTRQFTITQLSGEHVGEKDKDGRIHGHNNIEWKLGVVRWKGKIGANGRSINELTATSNTHGTTQYEGESDEQDPFVLLPSVLFQLKNSITGSDYGTLTVGMNRLRIGAGGLQQKSWTDIILAEYNDLNVDLQRWSRPALGDTNQAPTEGAILPVKNLKTDENAYVCFVDVFAAEGGYLTWDNDFFVGRCLQDQRLFSISSHVRQNDEIEQDKDRFVQFFNPSDWMNRDSQYESEPFDHRVAPSFHCGEDLEDSFLSNLKGFMDEVEGALRVLRQPSNAQYVKLKESIQKAIDRVDKRMEAKKKPRETKPKGPSDLYGFFMRAPPQSTTVQIPRTSGGLKNMRTRHLRKACLANGWRGTSHLCAPEPEKESVPPAMLTANLPGKSPNLHTFMRPVGHLIHAGDRDSRMLARLRMGLPRSIMEDVKRKLQNADELVPVLSSRNSRGSPAERVADEDEERFEMARAATIAALEEERNLYESEKRNANFLCIKFTKPGIVVWAAPPTVNVWERPGAPLFAVRLSDRPDVVVPVVLPSFDVRYPFEAAWYPVKTMKVRSCNLLNRIKQKARNSHSFNERPSKSRRPVPFDAKGKTAYKAGEESGSEGDVSEVDVTAPTGYDRPVAVSKHAFVCRLRRKGTAAFDRPQTRNWYRTILEEIFPEVEAECTDRDDIAYTKKYFAARFMNLNAPMVTGLEQRSTALIKGHIRCRRVQDPEPELVTQRSSHLTEQRRRQGTSLMNKANLPQCRAPAQVENQALPIENMWVAQSVFVNLTVFSAHDLDLGAVGLTGGNFRPYLKVKLGSEESSRSVVEILPKNGDGRESGMGSAYFYQHFTFETTLPGRTTMVVELWHQGTVFGDTLVGKTKVDLEDRWLVLRWRDLRAMSNKHHLERSIAPSEVMPVTTIPNIQGDMEGWVDPSDPEKPKSVDRDNEVKPQRAFAEPLPIECRDLVRVEDDVAQDTRVGGLRMLVDMCPASNYHAQEFEFDQQQEFEIRITIWDVSNIQIFKDFGERNDVYVKGRFSSTDYYGQDRHAVEVTDTHKYANTEASFNWRWKFTTVAPAKECSMELVLMDSDRMSEHDVIYFPKVFSFDQHLALAEQALREGRRHLGPVTETVVFDTWPESENFVRCRFRCLRRTLRIDKMRFAKLKMDVQIVPAGDSEAIPFERGQYSQPKGRVTLSSAVSNPTRTLKMLLGPSLFCRMHLGGALLGGLILALLIFATLFFMLTVFQLA